MTYSKFYQESVREYYYGFRKDFIKFASRYISSFHMSTLPEMIMTSDKDLDRITIKLRSI